MKLVFFLLLVSCVFASECYWGGFTTAYNPLSVNFNDTCSGPTSFVFCGTFLGAKESSTFLVAINNTELPIEQGFTAHAGVCSSLAVSTQLASNPGLFFQRYEIPGDPSDTKDYEICGMPAPVSLRKKSKKKQERQRMRKTRTVQPSQRFWIGGFDSFSPTGFVGWAPGDVIENPKSNISACFKSLGTRKITANLTPCIQQTGMGTQCGESQAITSTDIEQSIGWSFDYMPKGPTKGNLIYFYNVTDVVSADGKAAMVVMGLGFNDANPC